MTQTTKPRVVVVGGGLTGLCTAVFLALRGRAVTVLERAAHCGGRARTAFDVGFAFNQGAHAFFCVGIARRVLSELGIATPGGRPDPSGHVLRGGQLHALPAGLWSMLHTRALGWRGKAELARFIIALRTVDLEALHAISTSDWIAQQVSDADARALLETLIRVGTYGGRADELSAAVAALQLRSAVEHGVTYVDGGWQTLVDGLTRRALELGVEIRSNARAEAVEHAERVASVRLVSGEVIEASAVVLAVSPSAASSLVDGGRNPDLSAWAAQARPVRAATLDLALSTLPQPSHPLVLGTETPLYLCAHSHWARLAPNGGAMVHAMKYLGTESGSPSSDRAEIEALLDRAQPGWRDVVVRARFLPSMVVHHDLPTASRRGLLGRPPVHVPSIAGLFVAGDWVGSEGLLLDAALASARRVATRIVGDHVCSRAA